MTARPLISVITIFLDTERFIEEAIESVLAQTHGNWELLLVDDGSSDASTGIARRYAAMHPGRIRYLEHPGHRNLGTGASRNLGLTESRGELVAFLDSDDVWLPQRLERQVAILRRRPDVAMVYGPTLYWFDWQGAPATGRRNYVSDLRLRPNRRYEPPELLTRFLATGGGAFPCMGALTVRRSAAIAVGAFEDRLRKHDDPVFLSRVCLSQPVYVMDECLDLYRQHPDSICALARRGGTYDPHRPNTARRAYLEWLEAFLTREGVSDPRLLRALRFELLAYRQPLRYRIAAAPRRAQDALRFALRRITRAFGSREPLAIPARWPAKAESREPSDAQRRPPIQPAPSSNPASRTVKHG
jgi:glycosyltransferase involved in cell wall biosynthesis